MDFSRLKLPNLAHLRIHLPKGDNPEAFFDLMLDFLRTSGTTLAELHIYPRLDLEDVVAVLEVYADARRRQQDF